MNFCWPPEQATKTPPSVNEAIKIVEPGHVKRVVDFFYEISTSNSPSDYFQQRKGHDSNTITKLECINQKLNTVIFIQSLVRMWLARHIFLKNIAGFIRFQQQWRNLKKTGSTWELCLAKRKRVHRSRVISINYDVECKQLLVANRSELYYIFKSYMDNVEPAIKRENAILFAVHFRVVPDILSRVRFEGLITELVQILNDDPEQDVKIETGDAPLHFIAFLRLLILLARVSGEGKIPLVATLSNILRMMDASEGKKKMGGVLSRNSFSVGDMVYAGSGKLPSKQKALVFDLQQWLLESHFKGSENGPKEVFSRAVSPCKSVSRGVSPLKRDNRAVSPVKNRYAYMAKV